MKTVAIAAVLLSLAAVAQEKAQEKPQKAPTAEEKAMMEKYLKNSTPGPEHQKLMKRAGKWNLQTTAWAAPGAPPQKSGGTAEFTPILGGRFLREVMHGEMEGQPFEGEGVEGYDIAAGEHFGTWMDNMTTSMIVLRGKCAPLANKCATTGKMTDPVSGKTAPVKSVLTEQGDDKLLFELYGPEPRTHKQYKMLEIVYTRAGGAEAAK